MFSQNNPQNGILDVVSCGTIFPEYARSLCLRANHIFGSRTLLARLEEKDTIQAVLHTVLRYPEADAEEAIALASSGNKVVALSSGDALYHGFGCSIANVAKHKTPACPICFHPNSTAFQSLCHKIGLPWSEARLFSAHAQEPALRQILDSPFAIVHGGSPHTASALAKELLLVAPNAAKRACVIAEYLDSPRQRIIRTNLERAGSSDWAPTSLLILLPDQAEYPPLALGLPDSRYVFTEHLISSPELRAVAISKLAVPAVGVAWDLGAGSGALGLEVAALRPDCTVYGIERVHTRCQNILENRRRIGVANYRLVEGDILQRIPDLPDPHAIFVGGGGTKLVQILEHCLRRLLPEGRLVVSSVTLESFTTLSSLYPEYRESLVSLDIARSEKLGEDYTQLVPNRRVHLFTFRSFQKAQAINLDTEVSNWIPIQAPVQTSMPESLPKQQPRAPQQGRQPFYSKAYPPLDMRGDYSHLLPEKEHGEKNLTEPVRSGGELTTASGNTVDMHTVGEQQEQTFQPPKVIYRPPQPTDKEAEAPQQKTETPLPQETPSSLETPSETSPETALPQEAQISQEESSPQEEKPVEAKQEKAKETKQGKAKDGKPVILHSFGSLSQLKNR